MLKKTFIKGKMNKDLDNRIISDGDYRDALNVEIIDSEGSDVGALENSLSNRQLTAIDLGLNPINIGKYSDEPKDKIYWWEKSDNGCFLLEWDNANQLISIVLKDTRPEGNGRVFNLSEDHYITGITKVITEDVNKDLLMWTDDNMEICCINIERAKTWGENNFEEADIYLIKKQPLYAPELTPTYSSEESNFLETNFITFAYRYRYLDGERSAIGSYTNYNFNPQKFKMDYQTMENVGMVNSFNAVRIDFDTGPKQVTDIEIIAKRSNSNARYLIAQFNKKNEGWDDNETHGFIFSNNKSYQQISEKEGNRYFDNVPRKAKALTLLENIPVIGNYLEGYDIKDDNGIDIKMDYTVSHTSNDIVGSTIVTTLSNSNQDLVIHFSNIDSLQKGHRIIFDLKLNEPNYSGSYSDFLEYILIQDYDSPLLLSQDPDFITFINVVLNAKFLAGFNITVDTNEWSLTANTPFSISGANGTSITIRAISLNYTVDDTPLDPNDNPTNTHQEVVTFFFESSTIITYNTLASFASCKTNRSYEAGLVYQDKWTRKSTVLVSNSNTVNIPHVQSIFQNRLQININHPPPYWAESYKIVIKSQPLAYQTILANFFYVDGVFRWIKLEGANIDKVKEGDTLIVKSDLSGVVSELVKVRVIELATKEADFLEGNTDNNNVELIEQAGLYMKIKPTNFNMNQTTGSVFLNYDRFDDSRNGKPKVFLGVTSSLAGYLDTTTYKYVDYPITVGSRINIYFRNYEKDGYNAEYEKEFIVQSDYDNFQLWWEAEVIDLGVEENNFNWEFVRHSPNDPSLSNNSLRLSIEGNEPGATFEKSSLSCQIDITLSEGIVIFETEPKQADVDLYFETEQTFKIINGQHEGNLQTQTSSLPAQIDLNFHNCYVHGNGAESYRVKDALDENYLNIDLKPTTTSIEPYKETRRFADLTYGEAFIESTNFNGLNVFNASLVNFKLLDKQYNSIQFLFARDTNLLVFQEDKVGYVLFGKDLLLQANGIPVVSVTPEILGQYVPYQGENGIGFHPESIAWDSYRIYYVNPRRGTPIRLSIDGTSEINDGMVSHFRDLFINNPTSKKHGGYDPYHKKYVITAEDEILTDLNLACGNTINKIISSAFNYILNLNELEGEIVLNYNVYNGNATIQAVYDGVITVVSNVNGLGTINIVRDNINDDKLYVTITPVGEEASIEITNSCPLGYEMNLISIVMNDENDIGNTIINRFKRNSGQFYSDNHFFEVEPLSLFHIENGLEGVGKFPGSGETITIQSFKDTFSTGSFDESQQNRLGYLVTDQAYTLDDINTILAQATFLSITKNVISSSSETNQGTFVFNRPSLNDNLYLIWDYQTKNEAPIAVADSTSVNKGGFVDIDVLDNDTDADLDALTPIIVSQPQYGTVAVNPDGTIRYTHNDSENFMDSFTYKVNDGFIDSNTVAVDVSVGVDCSAGINASGSQGVYEAIIVLGTGLGSAGINYNALTVPDRFQIEYDGVIVADSKYVGDGLSGSPLSYAGLVQQHIGLTLFNFNGANFDDSGQTRDIDVVQFDVADGSTLEPSGGSGVLTFNKTTATPTTMKIIVTAPVGSTAWDLTGICPTP